MSVTSARLEVQSIKGLSAMKIILDEAVDPDTVRVIATQGGAAVVTTAEYLKGLGKVPGMGSNLLVDEYGALPVIDEVLQRFMGVPVVIHQIADPYKATCEIARQRIVMSSTAWASLCSEYRVLQRTPTTHVPGIYALLGAMEKAGETMKTTVVDVSNRRDTVPMRDKRKVTRPSDDRIEFVCVGIRDLVAQMSAITAKGAANEAQVAMFAQRYAELAEGMREARAALTEAEGNFEVAQALVVQMMGGA